jgi:hypothetical protein
MVIVIIIIQEVSPPRKLYMILPVSELDEPVI